jgi:hypothetical protein
VGLIETAIKPIPYKIGKSKQPLRSLKALSPILMMPIMGICVFISQTHFVVSNDFVTNIIQEKQEITSSIHVFPLQRSNHD